MEKREIETIVREVLAKLEKETATFPGLVEANGGKTHVTPINLN